MSSLHIVEQIDGVANPNDEARLRCLLARELEETGNYDAARAAMGSLWRRIGERPHLSHLNRQTSAEVLLRVGSLTGWIGTARQIEGAQEHARNLLCESQAIFESLEMTQKAIEAQIETGWCYWREGIFDEARVMLAEAINRLTDDNGDLKLLALLRYAITEQSLGRFRNALLVFEEARPIAETTNNHSLRGRYYMPLAMVLKNLASSESNPTEYFDKALIYYAAASYHFEQISHTQYQAAVENNIGNLLYKLGRFDEAEEHLLIARRLFIKLRDDRYIAQTDETRAWLLLDQGRLAEAERVIRGAVFTLEKGGAQALLSEALTTHAVILSRLGQYKSAQKNFARALSMSEMLGDEEGVSQASLAMLEELTHHLPEAQVNELLERTNHLLAKSQNVDKLKRLHHCQKQFAAMTASPRCLPHAVPLTHAQGRTSNQDQLSETGKIPSQYDPDVGDTTLGDVREIYRPGDNMWFAYVDVRSVYNRYGDFIGYLDRDGVTLRSAETDEPFAHQVGGMFYTRDGEVWGVTEATTIIHEEVTV